MHPMLAYLTNTANGQGHSNALCLWKSMGYCAFALVPVGAAGVWENVAGVVTDASLLYADWSPLASIAVTT